MAGPSADARAGDSEARWRSGNLRRNPNGAPIDRSVPGSQVLGKCRAVRGCHEKTVCDGCCEPETVTVAAYATAVRAIWPPSDTDGSRGHYDSPALVNLPPTPPTSSASPHSALPPPCLHA